MMRKTWMLAGLMTCAALVTGCGSTPPGDGTTLEGVWTGSLDALLAATGVKLPIAVKPEADFLFDGGALTITLKPDSSLLGWLLSVVVDGSYTKDNSTSLDKTTLFLGEASVKVLFFKIPLKDLAVTSQCIYKIEALNTLYIFPGYDLLPEALRSQLEMHPEVVPWHGGTLDGKVYTPLTLLRAA